MSILTITKSRISTWDELRKEVKRIPIIEAAQIREGHLDLERRGNRHFGLCPFHNDQSVGSFVIGGTYNGYKCFACGEYGDIISLIMELDNVSFKEALLVIAIETGLMTEDDASKFELDGETVDVHHDEDWEEFDANPVHVELDAKEVEKRNIVYSLFSEGNAIGNGLYDVFGHEEQEKLSNKHYYHLKEERGLTDEEIKEAGFFTMSEDYNMLAVLYYRLVVEHGLKPNSLNVPGFWRYDNTGTIGLFNNPATGEAIEFDKSDPQYYWYFNKIDALGIPIKDEEGNIIAIQLRPDKGRLKGKYIWFSSANNDGVDNKIDGVSSGSPHDIAYPEKWTTPHLFITEGKFKSLSITRSFRSPSISLQGINSYRGVSETIDKMNKRHDKEVKNVLVAFDSDMSYNSAVLNATIKMAKSELSEYNVYVAVWDYKYGKGIDDLINAGHRNKLSRITIEQLTTVSILLEDYEDESNEVREGVFYSWLKEVSPSIQLHPNRGI